MKPNATNRDEFRATRFSFSAKVAAGAALFFSFLLAWAQQPADPHLQAVFSQIDRTAANFHTTQAKFTWTQYTKLVDENDVQKGTVYYRRSGSQVDMAADVSEPQPPKYVLFTGTKLQLYQPKIDQITQYDTGKDRAAFESFLVLGFGGTAQDMQKAFDVSYLGNEKVDGVDCGKLNLVPKSPKVRGTFDHIWLWIDPARGVSLKQQLFAPNGDYRLAEYSDIRLNEKISDSVFKIKTTSKTKVVSPNG
jgi:outer membrane lipoprotein-sorting protein